MQMAEMLLLREAAVLIASATGAYTDFKTGYIYDWITVPLILLGAGIDIFEKDYSGLAIGAAVFAIGFALYYAGKIGGGDVKLYAGIALMLPYYNGIFVLSAALLAALSAVVFFSTYYTIKYLRRGIDLKYNEAGIRRAIMLLIIIGAYMYFLLGSGFAGSGYIALVGVPILFGTVFLALERGIRKEFFLQKVRTESLEDDEIIALDFMDGDKVKKMQAGFKGVIGEKEKKEMIGAGIDEVMVYRNLPRFGPFIFLGVLLAILMPGIGQIALMGT